MGVIDPNHNDKGFRYQFIGGSSAVCMEPYIVDTYLFVIAGVPIVLWRVKDFASDLLVLRLASQETVDRIYALEGEDLGSVAVTCVTLYFVRARLLSVNAKSLNYRVRITLMWTSMLYSTSFGYSSPLGTCQSNWLANRRNLVCAGIGMVFLFIQKGIINPRYNTSEGAEHTFGGWRSECKEAPVKECVEIEERRQRRTNAIFESGLATSRDPQHGYQSTWGQLVRHAKQEWRRS